MSSFTDVGSQDVEGRLHLPHPRHCSGALSTPSLVGGADLLPAPRASESLKLAPGRGAAPIRYVLLNHLGISGASVRTALAWEVGVQARPWGEAPMYPPKVQRGAMAVPFTPRLVPS